jgi:hypothetical protein
VVVVGVVAESPGLAPLAILSNVDVLPGAAECFVAAPGVVIVALFAAVVEASATCGVKAVANVVAGPATIVVVVGVVVEPPGFIPLAVPLMPQSGLPLSCETLPTSEIPSAIPSSSFLLAAA